MQEKKLEYIQYKLDYQENKSKWDRKVEAMAGDAIERMRELTKNEEKHAGQLAELETQNSRLVKENKVFREFIMNNSYHLNIEKIEEMIKKSEKDMIELNLAEEAVDSLRVSLSLKRSEVERGHKFENMQLLQNFFESGKKSLLEYKAIERIRADLAEESKPKDYSMIELVYSEKLTQLERHARVEYKIDNVLDYIGNSDQEVNLNQFIETRLQPYCKDP